MPKKIVTKETSNAKSKARLSTQTTVAIIGFVGVMLAACIGLIGTFVTSLIGYFGDRAQIELPIVATQTAEARIINTPTPYPPLMATQTAVAIMTAAPVSEWENSIVPIGEQLDFTVGDGFYGGLENLPEFYKLKSSPYTGIYLDGINVTLPMASYEVEYQGGERIRADTEICLINTAYTENFQSPLNFRADQITPDLSIFVDDKYELTITEIEFLITTYSEPRMDFDKVWILFPGAGGSGLPFKGVRADRVVVNSNQEKYEIDFRDFELKTFQGVTIFLPVLLAEPGKYQFQAKVNAIAHPKYQGDYSGKITLTTGRFTYEWVKIDDPRKYKLDAELNYAGLEPSEPKLIPCP